MSTWRIIHSGAVRGAMNMAIDEALYEAVAAGKSSPVLRLYRWEPATVTLGYAQRNPDAINFEACREYGFDVVRRSTGGRAVLHQHEVTYALIAPTDHSLFDGGILDTYKVIARPLQATLEQLGVSAELVPARDARGRGNVQDICFTAPASYELAVEGCKIAGSAQKRNERAFLQHGSIPVDLDPLVMARVLGRSQEQDHARAAALLAEKVGWVNRYRKAPVSLQQVETVMADTFRDSFPGTWEESVLSDEEQGRAEQLYLEKFYCPEWTVD